MRVLFAGTLVVAAAIGGSAQAGDAFDNDAAPDPSPWLFGDWNGERTRLKDRGIDFQFGYTSEIAYNTSGGSRRDAAYADQYVAGVTLDLEKLLGLQAAQFQATFTQRTGRNLVEDADLGTFQLVQEVYGRGQTTRLTQFWFHQQYLDGLLDWKIGRMGVGEDFASFACDFQNLTFCGSNPGNIVGDYIYNWPISQWGTRLKVNVEGFGYVQAGVYDLNPAYLGVSKALLPVWFSDSTGALIPAEVGWLPTFNGLSGSYKVGGWYNTSEADDVIDGTPGRGLYGAYINLEQNLSERLKLFLNAVVADRRTSTIDAQAALGVVYTGLFDARPQDDVGLAIGTTHMNDRVSDQEGIEGSEYAAEVYYTWRPTPALQVRPNLQYVYRPGGNDANGDVFVLGLKTSANF
ncbi:MAG: carbohydrate porin [Mesorhizobium sp.]|nr:carbohydrate porin [Mesorhizobium sp.]MBL8575768.1 carbohydrate porin [Mesorhizobium sp.]